MPAQKVEIEGVHARTQGNEPAEPTSQSELAAVVASVTEEGPDNKDPCSVSVIGGQGDTFRVKTHIIAACDLDRAGMSFHNETEAVGIGARLGMSGAIGISLVKESGLFYLQGRPPEGGGVIIGCGGSINLLIDTGAQTSSLNAIRSGAGRVDDCVLMTAVTDIKRPRDGVIDRAPGTAADGGTSGDEAGSIPEKRALSSIDGGGAMHEPRDQPVDSIELRESSDGDEDRAGWSTDTLGNATNSLATIRIEPTVPPVESEIVGVAGRTAVAAFTTDIIADDAGHWDAVLESLASAVTVDSKPAEGIGTADSIAAPKTTVTAVPADPAPPTGIGTAAMPAREMRGPARKRQRQASLYRGRSGAFRNTRNNSFEEHDHSRRSRRHGTKPGGTGLSMNSEN